MDKAFKNKVVLVTGACGTVGSEIVKQLLLFDLIETRALDYNESKLFMMNETYNKHLNFSSYYGDIREADKLK